MRRALSSDNNSLDDLSSLLTDVAVLPSAVLDGQIARPFGPRGGQDCGDQAGYVQVNQRKPASDGGCRRSRLPCRWNVDGNSRQDGFVLRRTGAPSAASHSAAGHSAEPGGEPLGTASSALPIDELSALLGEVPAAPQTDERSPRQLVRPSSLGQPELQIPPFAGYEVLAPSDAASIVPANRGYEVVVPGANPARGKPPLLLSRKPREDCGERLPQLPV